MLWKDEALVNMCVCTSLYLIPPLPFNRHCTTAATQLNLEQLCVFSLSLLSGHRYLRCFTSSLLCIFHIMSSVSKTFPQKWKWYTGMQWLTANPDRPYRVFYQTGLCSVHVHAAGVFTMSKCTKCHKALSSLVEKQTSDMNNFWNLAFSACGLLPINTKIYVKTILVK